MFADLLAPSSAGSLTVAVVALFFCVFQGWVAIKRPDYEWNAWSARWSNCSGRSGPSAVQETLNSPGSPLTPSPPPGTLPSLPPPQVNPRRMLRSRCRNPLVFWA